MKDVKGYSLFNDSPKGDIRLRNRAKVMVNIFEDHLDFDFTPARISALGMVVLLKYFSQIEAEERPVIYEMFTKDVRGNPNVIH